MRNGRRSEAAAPQVTISRFCTANGYLWLFPSLCILLSSFTVVQPVEPPPPPSTVSHVAKGVPPPRQGYVGVVSSYKVGR
jgi:hypothetical protein